jgi:hypothetical protein
MPAFLFRFTRTVTLAAGVAQDVDLPIEGARNWVVIVKNTGGANAVTAATVARSPLGTLFGPATALSTGIPLAAGDALEILGDAEPVTTLRLRLTSTSGTTVSIEGGGW